MQMQTLKFVKKEVPRWSAGSVDTPAGRVLRASTEWSWLDTWGMIKSRVGAFRMRYSVTPGLYAVGDPTKESDVFVTANYKLTFDILRRALSGLHAWILVLDTRSINVWCAAGKGTFGTDELVSRISHTKLDSVVSHRKLILPQLGAVGVNASDVHKKTGFRISFGPVHAGDIRAYLAAGYKKTREMSSIKFPMLDRMVLTPMEINPAMKKFPWLAAAILLIFGLHPSGILFSQAWFNGWPYLLLALISVFTGAFLTPILLPYVPFRSFAIKGWIVGLVSVFVATRFNAIAPLQDTILLIVAYLLFPALSSYLALQFTGSTTFTGMSGVKKELKLGVPLYIGTASISFLLMILFKLREWRFL